MDHHLHRRPRTVHFTNWDTGYTADTTTPADLLMAKEDAEAGRAAESACSQDAHELIQLLSYWIGDMNPLRSICITAAVADIVPPQHPEQWLASATAKAIRLPRAELKRRIADQLRIIHQAHPLPDPGSHYSFLLASTVLGWLLGNKKRTDKPALVKATRAVYLLASRVDPSLIANQSLGALSTLWCVSREALSNQRDDLFADTGIAGDYTDHQRSQRSLSALGNKSHTRGHS